MSAEQLRLCDHTSVGVIIENPDGHLAMVKRARFPVGYAPVAGHIDQHDTPRLAALAETEEELGVVLEDSFLVPTAISCRTVNNCCRRTGGSYHTWWVYRVTLTAWVELIHDPDEALEALWLAPEMVENLATRTRAYRSGELSSTAWINNPGIEDVWLEFLAELHYID
jgi:8-oxo-dGTP pyrophosphatase MutT (NUDIX family)